jgi:glycerol-3-phosphate acyltransferase PlsY
LTWQTVLLSMLLGYLLGSIPFGLILTRAMGVDIRSIGSGNIGATNVLRTGNKPIAAATLILDALKGTAAVLIARWYFGSEEAAMIAGLAAFAGHIFPVWLGFKGGKGVATYIGVLFGLDWRMGLLFLIAWIATAAITRYSSLSALVAVVAIPIVEFFMGDVKIAALAVVMSVIVWIKHRANISRLLAGNESRIGSKG